DADTIRLKIRRAKTDTAPLPDHSNDLTERPEAKNLVSIYAALTNTTIDHVLKTYQGKGFSVFKADLTEVVINAIVPIGQEAIRLLKDETYLLEILRNGADRASTLANPVVSEVEKIVGFLS
ncbi:MAG: tryptophan--tRNA ligase, partial [Acetobacter sp.]|nr:tryptophan--tRNA ligase [Acetobacter sp.]